MSLTRDKQTKKIYFVDFQKKNAVKKLKKEVAWSKQEIETRSTKKKKNEEKKFQNVVTEKKGIRNYVKKKKKVKILKNQWHQKQFFLSKFKEKKGKNKQKVCQS